MKNKYLALNFLMLCFMILVSCSNQKAETPAKPNFIIIMADDLGYDGLSCYGNKEIQTPNLDQMAKEGIRLTDFHSNGAVCSPTRAALMTGRYQQRTGITGVVTAKSHRHIGLPLSEKTFAEIFKEHGYITGMFGKWHLGYDKKFNPIQQGFDEFNGFLSGNIDYHSHVDQEGYQDWWQQDKLEDEKGYSTNLITDNAIEFLTKHKDNPFVLFISHEAPHYPFQGLKSKADRSPGDKNGVDFKNFGSEENISEIYKEMIEIMDADIGRTLATLKQLKLDSNTLVIFCSDNGYAPKMKTDTLLRGAKATVWEGGLRVPAIIKWSGHIKPNTLSEETILSMDFFPTLLDLADIEIPTNIDGVSIAQHLKSQQQLADRSLFWEHKGRYAVRKKNWKLVVLDANTKPELYDLEKDLREENNLADLHPNIVEALHKELNIWKADVSN